MNCPFCNGWAGYPWAKTPNYESAEYYSCSCGKIFYIAPDGTIKEWSEEAKRWVIANTREVVVFT